MNLHEHYMGKCIELAVKGLGHVAPNPMVGCVIVHHEKIIGEGYHYKYGDAHAEVNAIQSVKNKELLKSSTLYVNLEPCAHQGKTPPCTDLIIQYCIPYVVIGCIDPHSMVKGKGIERLIKAGIDIKLGILEEACKTLNQRFFTYHEKKRPYLILKWAQTADGFIDWQRGEENDNHPASISNAASRQLAHQWRSEEQAIMVGTNTALMDNPKLTVREREGKNPLRIVIDQWLRIPTNYHLFDQSTPTIVFTSVKREAEKNLLFVQLDFKQNILPQLLQELYLMNIQSVLVEGGEQLLNALIQDRLWDEARVFIAEKKFGKGTSAPQLSAPLTSKENINGDRLLIYKNC